MAKNKTQETTQSVTEFINSVEDEVKRNDSFKIIEIMRSQTGFEPKMWGPAIVGFGSYHYKYDSGREGDAPLAGFSPRKNALTLYFAAHFRQKEELLQQLGKHKSSESCVYIKKLQDIKIDVLEKMINFSMAHTRQLYPS